ncbi:alpha/beta fold hydrolase [Brevirhabdus sp.]|uniref:alpha/beta fold hydrolase n=1 Tax=Brevirhabdus sp. TaxID=2004514 RepID=UPI004058C1A3
MKLAAKILSLVALTSILVGCGAYVEDRAARREATAEADYPPLGQLMQVNGTTVHAYVEGSGPDLILIHGASGNIRDFTFDLVDRLKSDYRVIAFDRPGLGYTDRLPGFSGATNTQSEPPAAQADLLKAAADQLGVRNPIVLGQSYGGAVALAWALRYPDYPAALVLVSAASEPWDGGLGAAYGLMSSAPGGLIAAPLATAFAPRETIVDMLDGIFSPQAVPKGYADYIGIELALRRETLRANAQQVNTLKPYLRRMKKQYPTIDIPTEIIHGTADKIVPIEVHSDVLATEIPRANLTRLEGIGHMPHHVAIPEVIATINRAAFRAGLR